MRVMSQPSKGVSSELLQGRRQSLMKRPEREGTAEEAAKGGAVMARSRGRFRGGAEQGPEEDADRCSATRIFRNLKRVLVGSQSL